MKPKINLRLEVAGNENLVPKFEKCLESYLKYFDIGELLIYTTDNLFERVDKITTGKAGHVNIYDIDEFYQENQEKFPQSFNIVLDYSKNKTYKGIYSSFYLRMRLIMDYYLMIGKKPCIFSDVDIIIYDNIKPIIDWINNPSYILYHADPLDDEFSHSKILKTDPFLLKKQLPQFNSGWLCIPKIKIDMKEVFRIMICDMACQPIDQLAVRDYILKSKIKTKLVPRRLLVSQTSGKENKTLAHLGPYGLE